MSSAEANTELQAAYADRKEKARTLREAAASFVRAWHEHEEAKEKEDRLFTDLKSRMQSK